jgi:hypothetical protein
VKSGRPTVASRTRSCPRESLDQGEPASGRWAEGGSLRTEVGGGEVRGREVVNGVQTRGGWSGTFVR